jgi:hypothetical protein
MSLLDTASLIVTPNGYKEGKLYSVIPSDGSGDLSVTRATTATRVNSAGLVELVPYNLVTYSQNFNNADWINFNQTLTANSVANPINGNVDAYTITLDSGTSLKVVLQSNNQNGNYTQSVYVKAGTHNFIQLLVGNDTNPYANFNIALGTFNAYNCTASITSAGNGWYRCSINYSTSIGGSGCYIWAVDSLTAARASATSSTGNFYAYGFQLNEGTLKDYQKTETRLNIPRLDYSNGSCPSILVEPQRTNSVTYSSSLDNVAWNKLNTTISANAATAPDGTLTADLIYPTTTGTDRLIEQAPAATSGQTWTSSFFVKSAGFNWVLVYAPNLGACWFNASTGAFGTVAAGVTATVLGQFNGFWRVSFTGTIASSNAYFYAGPANANGSSTATTSGTNGLLIWGAQLEAGSYPTSYIPTTSASVTRNADVISKTGISSLIGQTEGTIFLDVENTFQDSTFLLQMDDSTADNRIIFGTSIGTQAEYFVITGGSVQANFAGGTLPNKGHMKLALAYKNNDFAFYANGQQINLDTSGLVPAMSVIRLGENSAGAGNKGANYNAAALWKTRLTNDQLEILTGDSFDTYAEMASYYNYTLQ